MTAWPLELRITDAGRNLLVKFEDGRAIELTAELLRVESPSAEVKGHGPGQEQLVWGKRDVTIVGAEPVGNYAVRLKFSDGHDTGLYTWTYLNDLGANQKALFAAYEAKLLARGLSRQPR